MSVPSTLAAHPYFRALDPAICRALDRQCIWLRTTAGSWILDQSATDRDVYFIMSGQLRAVYNIARQDLIFNDMNAGSIFGEMAAIDGAPRAASVFAIVDSLVAKMPGPLFVDTMFTHRCLCEAVVRTLIERLRAMSGRVGELGALNVRTRVHAELLRLARRDRDDPRRAIIVTPPNQSELAARINTRRETVSREINAMERNGLIERRRGAIVITDVLRLTAEIQQANSG
jgi:CRP-like cAMP-binding protein